MQRTIWWAAVVAIGAFLAAPLAAQVRVDVTREGNSGTKVDVTQSFRSSHLIGMRVKNKEGKDIGRIDDLVIGLGKGDIRYAALSFGGFAGIGTKLFAVPWQAMTFHFGEKDRYFVFDVTEEQLKSAPGFDSNNWPNVGDAKWSTSIDKHYKIERETAKDGNIAVDDAYRVSTLKGMKVRNDQGKDLGHVDELVFDVKGGEVNYVALSFGSFAGLGGKLFAIPFQAFRFHHAANDRFLVLNVSEEKLKAAPGFDSSHWPDTADPSWSRDVDKYYEDLRTANRRDARKD
jgi:sporulation protein YlmC with PRC-barrel domain